MDTKAQATYREAVEALAKLALNHTSSSAEAAAQVLLSTYNHYNYQLNPVDLGSLDRKNLKHAMSVLTYRAVLRIEPQEQIDNGSEIFHILENRWPQLHVKKRYQQFYEG